MERFLGFEKVEMANYWESREGAWWEVLKL